MQRFLFITGIVAIVLSVAWPHLKTLGLGNLPGDITLSGEKYAVHLPLASCLLITVVINLILWLARR